jgi:formylglycine-generating enzyme required for sulfatase activity
MIVFIDPYQANFHSRFMKPLPFPFAALICGVVLSAVASAGQAQTRTATNLPAMSITLDPRSDTKMEFVLIPAGTFTMGVEESRPDEKPVTKVTLTKPFYFGKYEVTQAQWQAVMGSNPSYYKGTNLPVEQVSWNAAQGFLTNLNERVSGYHFRLPSEAEWEYACRAGSTTQYSFGDGDTALPEYGWFTGNGERKTHPVGEKKPNAWGLYDMHGNVWEWCQDWYAPYPGGEVTDPTGPATGATIVMRGGSWSHGSRDLWSSFRFGRFNRNFPFRSVGFRVVAVVK